MSFRVEKDAVARPVAGPSQANNRKDIRFRALRP